MTNAELAILSLIAERPRYGYEIEQVIEARGMRDWTEVGFSSIYYLLKKLEQKGFVSGALEPAERGLARKVYRVTGAGRAAFEAATLEALSMPQRGRSPLQLGLANLPAIPPAETLDALRQYRQRLAERRAHVQARRNAQRPLPDHVEAMFDLSLSLLDAELGWIERFIARMERKPHDQS